MGSQADEVDAESGSWAYLKPFREFLSCRLSWFFVFVSDRSLLHLNGFSPGNSRLGWCFRGLTATVSVWTLANGKMPPAAESARQRAAATPRKRAAPARKRLVNTRAEEEMDDDIEDVAPQAESKRQRVRRAAAKTRPVSESESETPEEDEIEEVGSNEEPEDITITSMLDSEAEEDDGDFRRSSKQSRKVGKGRR